MNSYAAKKNALFGIILFVSACGLGDLNEDTKEVEQLMKELEQIQSQVHPQELVKEEGYVYPGMYRVGGDLPAGEYIVFPQEPMGGYYQVSKDSTGTMDSIVANDNFQGTRYITVKDGQYLTLTNAKATLESKVPAQVEFRNGMYKVGKDIPAGEYLIFAEKNPMNSGYFEVTGSSEPGMANIHCNDNFSNSRYITVKDGQYLKLNLSQAVPAVDAPAQTDFKNGMYKVGKDIPPGEYKIMPIGEMDGYVEVDRNSSGGMNGIVTNDNFQGQKIIRVKEGQYLKLGQAEIVDNI
ncbi:MAG TPA: hypothetical protein PLG59_12835 [bacterium]|nr:hypothetical protein [bacterium]